MITAVVSAKGGAGKTTTTIMLATSAIAIHPEMKVLIIDLDAQANATSWLIPSPTDSPLAPPGDGGRATFRWLVDGDIPTPLEARSNLHVLPAGERTRALVTELGVQFTRDFDSKRMAMAMIRDLMVDLQDDGGYDLIVIDTPPSEQHPSLIDAVLTAADAVVVPTKAELTHTQAAQRVLHQLAKLIGDADTFGGDLNTAIPLGVLVFDIEKQSRHLKRLTAADLAELHAVVPLFDTEVRRRAAPAGASYRWKMTPAELVAAMPHKRDRLRQLRSAEMGDTRGVTKEQAQSWRDDVYAVWAEFEQRATDAGLARWSTPKADDDPAVPATAGIGG